MNVLIVIFVKMILSKSLSKVYVHKVRVHALNWSFSVAHLDLVHVAGASVSDLSAPCSAGSQVVGSLSPSSLFDQAVEGVEGGKSILAEVVSHVDKDVLCTLA